MFFFVKLYRSHEHEFCSMIIENVLIVIDPPPNLPLLLIMPLQAS